MENEKTQRLIKIFGPAIADVAKEIGAGASHAIAALLYLGLGTARHMGISKEEALEVCDRMYDLTAEPAETRQ